MNRYPILFVVPADPMMDTVKNILKEENIDISVAQSVLHGDVDIVREYIEKGVEVVISRAGTLRALEAANISIAMVELTITGFDLIDAIEKARIHGSRIAVVAFQSMVLGIDYVAKSLGVDIGYFFIKGREEIPSAVASAAAQGYEVVLGGPATAAAARAHNLPSVLIGSSKASILQAVFEAVRVARAIENEKYKRELFSAVVDYANDGIITVDTAGIISTINPRAAQITGFRKAIGNDIDTVWPDLKLTNVIKNREQHLGQIMAINGRQVFCNKVPIIVNNRPVGAVANFQEITRIQQLEAAIRRKIYSKGHVARFSFSDIWGTSAAIQKVIRIAKDYAATESNILVTGATGTGKEVFTQSMHNFSRRKNGPFVAVNCAALPGQILESELFGYVKGAFTGASEQGKPGLFELAHGGTIFLDEITELDYANQGRLLRVLQEKVVVRLGSDTVTPVDVRIIAATNRDLGQAVEEKKFRDDLFYRLNVLKLHVPTLRERKADIRDYANKFLARHTPPGGRPMSFRPGALRLLEKFDWPGNIRQLQNTIERVAVLCKEPVISESIIAQCLDIPDRKAERHNILSREIDEIRQALATAKGRQSGAAKLLGINRSTLWRKMQRLGMP